MAQKRQSLLDEGDASSLEFYIVVKSALRPIRKARRPFWVDDNELVAEASRMIFLVKKRQIESSHKIRTSSVLSPIRSSHTSGHPSGTHFQLNSAYWSLPVALTCVQYWVTATSMHEIRYEELAESVRNVFWLSHRLVFDGASSNVGWYGLLLLVYQLFGFSLFSAKFVKLGLYLIGITCVADILHRCMGVRTAIVPLIAIGLSPTLLYMESLQTSYGVDLPYAAICLWLVLSIRPDAQSPLELGKTFVCGAIAMIAAMSYPTFLLYWPSLLLVWVWQMRRNEGAQPSAWWMTWQALSGTAGLAIPLVVAFAYVVTPSLLLWDPATHSGLFRGGGHLAINATALRFSLFIVSRDLLVHGWSYYFDVTRPDFSGPLAIAGLICIVATTIYLLLKRQVDITILLVALLLLALSLVVPSLSDLGPGIRRSTGILVAYFVLFSVAWYFYQGAVAPINIWVRRSGVILCLLVPLDHALKLPSLGNDLARKHEAGDAIDWFTIAATPAKSLEVLLEQVDKGQLLSCPIDDQGRIIPCRYQEAYAAVAGYRLWNVHSTSAIHAVDWKTGRDIVLTPFLWTGYYFPH